jgi:cold shock CspA family protein
MRAIISYYNPKRRFGFVTTPSGEQFFFHTSNIEVGFNPILGAEVEFQIGAPVALGKRPQAVRVTYPNPKTQIAESDKAGA